MVPRFFKEQASKDKQRERSLSSQGYKIFRFTGSEIFKDPFKCIHEIITYIENYS